MNIKPNLSYFLSFIKRMAILLLAYTFSRLVFFIYNKSFFEEVDLNEYINISIGGLKFDTAAIVYSNIVFMVLYNLPLKIKVKDWYQNILKWLFINVNSIALAMNFADVPYFEFVFQRADFSIFKEFSNEKNILKLFLESFIDFYKVLFLYILTIYFLIFTYNKVKFNKEFIKSRISFYSYHTLFLLLVLFLGIGGARGGYYNSLPFSLGEAGKFVSKPKHMSIVLNTPFSIMKTIDAEKYERLDHFDQENLEKIFNPIHISNDSLEFNRKNVIIILMESFSAHFIGGLNKNHKFEGYRSYTPFLDSLIPHSYTFDLALSNGRKSIESMPSILASIPAIKLQFVLSPYFKNDLTTLPNLLKEKDYFTAFFHGAANGSMGFEAFTKRVGIDNYYGKTEYNNDDDFDGTWGIWDEEFFQFSGETMNKFKEPFFSLLYSVSSHHPFKVPEKYKGKFPYKEYELQRSIGYSDYALKKFFEKISKEEWYNNTLFVITADHATTEAPKEFKNEIGEFAIPIIFFDPGENIMAYDEKTIASHSDIMPSILDYLNYNEDYLSFGSSLFEKMTISL